MLYTVEELVERCGITTEFIEKLRNEGFGFEPRITVISGGRPIELYEGLDALILLWIKAFVDHGWGLVSAQSCAESLIEGHFEDADEEIFDWDNTVPERDS